METRQVIGNVTLDGAGIIFLGLGVVLAQSGEYGWGIALALVGAGCLALKYFMR